MHPEHDAFPKAPGFYKKLGLTKADKLPKEFIGWGPWRKQWYSICSVHYNIKPDCNCCLAGSYNNVWKTKISQIVYKISPRFWRWWVNGRSLKG